MSNTLAGADLLEHLDSVLTLIAPLHDERRWDDMAEQHEAGNVHGPFGYRPDAEFNSWRHQPRNEAALLAGALGQELGVGPYRRTEIGHTVHYEFPLDQPHMRTMITLPFQAGWSDTWKWTR